MGHCLVHWFAVITMSAIWLIGSACGPSEDAMREMIYLVVKEAIDKSGPKTASTTSQPSSPNTSKSPTESEGKKRVRPVVSSAPKGIQDRVLESQKYFEKLTQLMEDYEPGLPKIVDNTDLLRCLTSEVIGNDADMRRLDKSLVKQREQSREERRKIKRNFYERVYEVNFRIDHDWRSRAGFTKKKRYGCWDRDDGRYYDYITRSDCTSSYQRWRLRSSRWVKTSDVNLYSGTARPAKPELMKRITAESVRTPSRHYCSIRSVEREMKSQYGCKEYGRWQSGIRNRRECDSSGGQWRLRAKLPTDSVVIVCESTRHTDQPSFVVHAAIPKVTSLRIGDVISIPQGQSRGVDPALIYGEFESFTNEKPTLKHWVLNVNQGAIRIELANKDCPTEKELGMALCNLADRKSNPDKVVENCTMAGNVNRLREFARQWEKNKKRRRDSAFMVKTYRALTSMDDVDLSAKLRLVFYLQKSGKTAEVEGILKTILNQSPKRDELKEVQELAEVAGLDEIRLEALRGSCRLGFGLACSEVEKATKPPEPEVEAVAPEKVMPVAPKKKVKSRRKTRRKTSDESSKENRRIRVDFDEDGY